LPSLLPALLAALVLAASAAAEPTFSIHFGPNASSLSSWAPPDLGDVSNLDGTRSFIGNGPFGGGNFEAAWSVTTDQDPFVDGVFAITNNSGVVQTFMILFGVPVVPSLAGATSGASAIGTLTVDGNGGTLGHVTNGLTSYPMFTALVDGNDFMGLLGFDSSATAAFGSVSTGSDSFGLPGLSEVVPGGVHDTIGVRLAFTLTDGDSASFTSRFEVVPEPATGLLLGIGVLALAAAHRRQ